MASKKKITNYLRDERATHQRRYPLAELQDKRMSRLRYMRSTLLHDKEEMLAALERYVRGEAALSKNLVRRVFQNEEISRPKKDTTAEQRQMRKHLFDRMRTIPKTPFAKLGDFERTRICTMIKHLVAYKRTVCNPERDLEIACNEHHPRVLEGLHDYEEVLIRNNELWDAELEESLDLAEHEGDVEDAPSRKRARDDEDVAHKRQRRRLDLSKAPTNDCVACANSDNVYANPHLVVDSAAGDVICTACGHTVVERDINCTLSGIPFSDEIGITAKGGYDSTGYFMKHILHLRGGDGDKVPTEVIEHVRRHVRGRRVNCESVRRFLKTNYSQYYKLATYIMNRVTGNKPIRLSATDLGRLREMHLLFSQALHACPYEIKDRKSSLTNDYLTFKFFQMLGLEEYLDGLRLMKGDKKVRQHDTTFKWCLTWVRTHYGQRPNVKRFWVWHPTPKRFH